MSSGFRAGALRNDDYKPVRESRERGGFLEGDQRAGMIGKVAVVVPRPLRSAAGVNMREHSVALAIAKVEVTSRMMDGFRERYGLTSEVARQYKPSRREKLAALQVEQHRFEPLIRCCSRMGGPHCNQWGSMIQT